jgi:hypothetical protein
MNADTWGKTFLVTAGLAAAGALGYFGWNQFGHGAEFKREIRNVARDPGSVQFGMIDRAYDGSGWCGYANMKNGYGAYTGSRLYYVDTTGYFPEVVTTRDNPNIIRLCVLDEPL